MTRPSLSLAAFFVVALTAAAMAASPPPMWDNLVRAPSKKFDSVYILPGADFRGYTKVMFDTPEVAFHKDFQRDYNNETRSLSNRISDKDLQEATELVRTSFAEIVAKAYTDAGFQVVTTADQNTLRIGTAVINIDVYAPDQMTAGRSMSFAEDAGEATLVVEARDSVTGAILGRIADRRSAGNSSALLRNRMTNRRDFRQLFQRWATASAAGLSTIKTMSPYNAAPVR